MKNFQSLSKETTPKLFETENSNEGNFKKNEGNLKKNKKNEGNLKKNEGNLKKNEEKENFLEENFFEEKTPNSISLWQSSKKTRKPFFLFEFFIKF